MCFPPSQGGHKEFFAQACVLRSSSCCLPFAILNLHPGPCQIQGLSCPRVHSSLCLPLPPAHLLSPLPSLTSGPSPLHISKCLCRSLISYVPCASSSPSPCSVPSLGVFCSLISLRVSFWDRVRPGSLHSLAIASLISCLHGTWPCCRR